MRWRARKQELIWKEAFETRLGAFLAHLPRKLAWLTLGLAYAGLVAVLYVPMVPILDVLSPLAGHFAGGAASACTALLIKRRIMLTMIVGVSLTLVAHAVPALLAGPEPLSVAATARAASTRSHGLKVMALNVWRDNAEHDRLVRAVIETDADVVLLAEVTPAHDMALARLREIYPYAVYCPQIQPCSETLLSRVPLAATGARSAAPNRPGLVWARLADGPMAGVTVVVTHVFRPTKNWHRHVQHMEGLVRELARHDGPLVIGGDFNATAASRTLQSAIHRSGLTGVSKVPSWPARPFVLPQFAIDHVLVRGTLRIRDRGLGGYAGSDHLPVWSIIERTDDIGGGV